MGKTRMLTKRAKNGKIRGKFKEKIFNLNQGVDRDEYFFPVHSFKLSSAECPFFWPKADVETAYIN